MNLKNQRRMAAEILNCGINRVWLDPSYAEDISDAITRDDVRAAINDGKILALRTVGVSRGRTRYKKAQRKKGRRRGVGSRRGASNARRPDKETWMRNIRIIRRTLRELRDSHKIETKVYRTYYRKAKGGMFRSRAHLLSHLKTEGRLKEEKGS